MFNVLKELTKNKYASKEQISKKLGISIGEVDLAFQALEDLGYLRRVNFNCDAIYCNSCQFRSVCNVKVEVYEVRVSRE